MNHRIVQAQLEADTRPWSCYQTSFLCAVSFFLQRLSFSFQPEMQLCFYTETLITWLKTGSQSNFDVSVNVIVTFTRMEAMPTFAITLTQTFEFGVTWKVGQIPTFDLDFTQLREVSQWEAGFHFRGNSRSSPSLTRETWSHPTANGMVLRSFLLNVSALAMVCSATDASIKVL